MAPRNPDSKPLPDFLLSPDLGELVQLALTEMAGQQNGDHPASPVLARAYRRAANQIKTFHAEPGGAPE